MRKSWLKVKHADARLLIVDDEPTNVMLLEAILANAGYTDIRSTYEPREVEEICRQWSPDLVLLDLMMPEMNGYQVMERLQQLRKGEPTLPILVLTADISPETRQTALSQGAQDFLTKPFDHGEVLLRLQNLLAQHFLHQQLQQQNLTLEARVLQRTQELEQSQLEVLERLARAAEFRDDDTGQHTQRVGILCGQTALQLQLSAAQSDLIRHTAPLHDVGKIGIPDQILLKPGKLSPEEFSVIKTHTLIGANLLAGGRSEMVQMAERIARTHHERWDGSGYPHGLQSEEIPLEGRITAVVDVFDALTHERPYKQAWSKSEAVSEIQNQRGRQFDPAVVTAFLRVIGA